MTVPPLLYSPPPTEPSPAEGTFSITNILSFLSEWQTLLGALIALVAALWTIRIMSQQSRGEEMRHAASLERKKLAARAQMPDALSGMAQYVRSCCLSLLEGAEKPQPPLIELSTLKGVIEHIDDLEAAKTFALVSWYQVQNARIQDARKLKEVERNDRIYDAVLLFAHVNALFDYARNEGRVAKSGKPSREEMKTAFKNALSLEATIGKRDQLQGVMELINRRHA
ncbi:hypothetical protein [Rhizobium wuzhouense]|uniref:DUF4760 domain-containing protein n=1 Tax=Rhizobium wuzhouense TaxID=1986026 RepID=A0ABX5NY62_9HYPH|nr:hypothetical protein [Rhizobium wuzhouense]PYB77579.1 hypothetical protein DMY87_04300 [Rhizobium wuzhouense]